MDSCSVLSPRDHVSRTSQICFPESCHTLAPSRSRLPLSSRIPCLTPLSSFSANYYRSSHEKIPAHWTRDLWPWTQCFHWLARPGHAPPYPVTRAGGPSAVLASEGEGRSGNMVNAEVFKGEQTFAAQAERWQWRWWWESRWSLCEKLRWLVRVWNSLVWLLLRWQGLMSMRAEASQRADWEDLATTFRERGKRKGGGKHDSKHAWLGVGRASMDEEHSGKGRKMTSYNWETQSVCLDSGVAERSRILLRRRRHHGFSPSVCKTPWRKAWQPTPVFLPGESHGQRSPAGYIAQFDTTEETEHA